MSFLGLLASLTACKTPKPPKKELCIVGDLELLACNDPRRDEQDQNYFIDFSDARGYVCTNPDDYEALVGYVEDLRADLAKCIVRAKRRR